MISKNDYLALGILFQNECTNEMKSMTLKSISEQTELSIPKIRKTISTFISLKLVNEGALQHREKTYYITEDGISKIKELL